MFFFIAIEKSVFKCRVIPYMMKADRFPVFIKKVTPCGLIISRLHPHIDTPMTTSLRPDSDRCKKLQFRNASPGDLNFLHQLETLSFSAHRQSSRRSLKHSILSTKQRVIIAERKGKNPCPAGAAIIFCHKHTIRLYSIAVLSSFQKKGVGKALLAKLFSLAEELGCERISLEVDAANSQLISWYKRHGFEEVRQLADYYGPGESCCRMVLTLIDFRDAAQRMVIICDDQKRRHLPIIHGIKQYSPEEYLSKELFARSNRYHIINLCHSYRTHSLGYHVSLMAAARNHRITPSIMAIKDIANLSLARNLLEELKNSVEKALSGFTEKTCTITVIFGHSPDPGCDLLARKLYAFFEIPFFSVTLEQQQTWQLKKIQPVSLSHIATRYPELFRTAFSSFLAKRRPPRTRLKTSIYDLAILIDKKEATPPSCPLALEKFANAAEKTGFLVEFIQKTDHRRMGEFDALFLRETTAVSNHTYAMARQAWTEGLVVIDDPWSILLCSNKAYLYERLNNAGIDQPRSWLLTRKNSTAASLATLPFPLVLKLPESSFSQGVFRVENQEELEYRLHQMFSETAVIIAQEFLASAYDWRIGILDNAPLYACKYYMANNHWQIYNWKAEEQEEQSGHSEGVPIEQVPGHILQTAVKAASLIGNGLYGVDLKERDTRACVIEVNDNPSIDAGVEDELLGERLYLKIMASLFNRIETERQQVRYLI